MSDKVDIRVMTAAERKAHVGKVRAAHREAFKILEAAGAHAAVIVSIVEIEGRPRQPASVFQARRAKGCTLSAADIQDVVAALLIHNWESMER